jgi:hypothetical protein
MRGCIAKYPAARTLRTITLELQDNQTLPAVA